MMLNALSEVHGELEEGFPMTMSFVMVEQCQCWNAAVKF
jgi:hypothetical protein